MSRSSMPRGLSLRDGTCIGLSTRAEFGPRSDSLSVRNAASAPDRSRRAPSPERNAGRAGHDESSPPFLAGRRRRRTRTCESMLSEARGRRRPDVHLQRVASELDVPGTPPSRTPEAPGRHRCGESPWPAFPAVRLSAPSDEDEISYHGFTASHRPSYQDGRRYGVTQEAR